MRRDLVGLAFAAGCAPRLHLSEIHAADIDLADGVTLEIRADGAEAEHVADGVTEWLARVHGPRVVPLDGDLVLELASFRSGDEVAVGARSEPDDDGGSHLVYVATRTAFLEGSYVLTGRDGVVLDRLDDTGTADVWTADALDPERAKEELGPAEDAIGSLARAAGFAWARRVSSGVSHVTRPWYPAGDPRMSEAALRVRLGDWDGAIPRWREVADDPLVDERVRAHAMYDLGVAWEAHGQHRRAWLTVLDAAALDPAPRIEHYRDTLDVLRAERRQLQQRMTLPGEASEDGGDGDG